MSQAEHSGTEQAQELAMQTTQDMEVADQMISEDKTLEPHILLLKEFLGQQLAERFLDPTYEISVSPVQHLHLETEGCGAKDYWRLLREHSKARLMQHMSDIPGAIMVKCSGFNHLQPSKRLNQIKDFRRKLWLMSRASEINQEKSLLFMTNNPLPDVDEPQHTSSSFRCLNKDTFLTKKIHLLEKSFHLPPLKTTNVVCTETKHKSNDQTMVNGNNYRFLTKETFHEFEDGFSKRCIENNLQIQWPNLKCSKPQTFIEQSRKHADNASSCRATNGSPSWEPLTYTALMDSKPSLSVSGRGHFRHGEPPQWFVNSSDMQLYNSAIQVKV